MEALETMETLVRNTKWQLQEAKAMLSELVKAAIKEPQVITVRGEEKAVVISMNEYKRLVK